MPGIDYAQEAGLWKAIGETEGRIEAVEDIAMTCIAETAAAQRKVVGLAFGIAVLFVGALFNAMVMIHALGAPWPKPGLTSTPAAGVCRERDT